MMKFRYLLTLIFIVAFVMPAFAQDDFPEDLLEQGSIELSDPELVLEEEFDDEDAWENYEAIAVSMTKAKEITKTRLRVERKPLLEAQDVLFMKAQESSSDTSAIVTEKQRLRDITASADSASTLDELKGLNP